ncbi:hypothetical protein ACHQM5_029302 [Ranunculus cassubicifolius]
MNNDLHEPLLFNNNEQEQNEDQHQQQPNPPAGNDHEQQIPAINQQFPAGNDIEQQNPEINQQNQVENVNGEGAQDEIPAAEIQAIDELIKGEIRGVVGECCGLLASFYLLGIAAYLLGAFTGDVTFPPIDGFYFATITLTSIGFGDIVPNSTLTKAFICLLVLYGTGYVFRFVDSVIGYIAFLRSIGGGDQRSNWWRIGLIVFGTVVFCIVQVVVIVRVESLEWIDTIYLSLISSSTIGYGDKSFKTQKARVWAGVSLLVTPLIFARIFDLFVTWRIEARKAIIEQLILSRDNEENAWWSNDERTIKRNCFALHKLTKQGKITQEDLESVNKQFNLTYPQADGEQGPQEGLQGDAV